MFLLTFHRTKGEIERSQIDYRTAQALAALDRLRSRARKTNEELSPWLISYSIVILALMVLSTVYPTARMQHGCLMLMMLTVFMFSFTLGMTKNDLNNADYPIEMSILPGSVFTVMLATLFLSPQ